MTTFLLGVLVGAVATLLGLYLLAMWVGGGVVVDDEPVGGLVIPGSRPYRPSKETRGKLRDLDRSAKVKIKVGVK